MLFIHLHIGYALRQSVRWVRIRNLAKEISQGNHYYYYIIIISLVNINNIGFPFGILLDCLGIEVMILKHLKYIACQDCLLAV